MDNNFSTSLDTAVTAAAITPSDTVAIATGICRAIYVGGAGNVVVYTPAGDTVTFVGCVSGSTLPVKALRINTTNTTATYLVALY